MPTADKFGKCCYNISNSDYYWKGVVDHTFPEVLPVWDTSYTKIPKTKQFENICAQPRNFGNVVTTFLILIITGKV